MKIKKIIMNIASVITALSMLMSGTAVFAEVLLSGAVNLNSGKRYFNSAMYENYIYALTTTDQCLDVFDMDTLEKTCSIAMSYNHSQPFNRYVYIKNDELYALANDGIHRYSLKNPAEPEEIKLYSSYKSYDYLEVEDNYMYLPYFGNEGLISVNLDTGEKTKISDTKYTGLFYYNGYLYAINKNTVDVYNTENGFEIPELIAQKDFGANIIGINAIGNTLFMTAWTDSQSVMDLWWIDISEPELLESRSFSKWVAPGTGNRRLADINFVNGLMLVPSTDNKMYTFDITDEENGVVRDIVLLETLSIQGNPYRFSMNQSKMSFQNTSFMLYDYSIDYMQISSSEINKLPILITGKAIGQQNVCVELAGQKRNVSVDEFGHFEAIFDDTKIPNGEYIVTAYSTDNEEAVDEKTITIAAERLSLSADYEKGKASAALTNYSDDYTAAVILAGYKDNQMADYDLSEIILTGNDETNAELNINDADYDFVKIMAARKTDNGYIPEADMIVYGSDNREKVIPDIDNGGFEIRCDMNFSEGVVTVNAAASDAKTDILVIAEKPEGEGYEYIDMIPSSEKTGIMFALKAPMIENKPYSVTISAIGAGDYLYKKGEFTYVGEDTVNAILKSISEKTDEKEFFEALKENSELINVDMSEKSDFAALTETYRTEVFNALTGKDYSVLGAVRLKLDFDGAVSEQLHNKNIDDGLAELNNAQSVTEFENALKNNSALEIDIEKDSFYRLLSESSKIKVFDNIKNTEYADIESLKKDYEIYSSLWYINDAKYSDIEKRIDESKEVTKIKFPNEFNSFTNVQKTLYFTKIADKDYETVSDLQKALDNMIEPILSIKSSSKAVIQSKYREIIENPVRYAFAQYKDYVYSVESSKVVIIDFSTDKENPVVVENPDNEYLKVGTNNNSRVNRYTYQEDGYLYVYSMTGMIRRFSLEDPSNPQYVKDYTYGGGVVSWMDVNGDYLYVNAEGRLAVVNLETGEYKKTDFGLNTFRSYGDYIYAIKSGKVEVYSIEDRMNPSLVGSKAMTYTADGTEKNRIPSDIEYLNGYVMITNYGNNAMAYDLWMIDVSEPEKIQEKEFIKYSGNDSFKRIGYMEIKNGLLFVGDVDTHIHVFDVTALPYIEEITDFSSPSVNHYILSVSDCDIYAKTGGSVRRYSYNVDNLELNDANIAQRPVKVTGKAAGSSKVEVTLGTMTKIAEVARDGSFEAEFDDDFVPNGKYTAKAKLCNGSETEKTAEININLTPRIEVTENYSAGNESISVRNAVDAFEGILITCGIKNGSMTSYSIARENVGESCVITNSLSTYADCDTIKSYLIRKTDSGYVLVWEGKAYGKAIEEVGANDVETKNGISVSTDVEHAKKQVVVNVGSDKAIGSVLAVVLKPGFDDISETSIEYIGTGVVRDSKAAVGFCLNSSYENTDYSVLVSVKGDGKYLYGSDKFKYFGPETLNPIFEQIKNANDGNIESILRDNQDKLSIDLSENSDYAALEEKYKKVVLSAVIGNDYIEKGSTQLKNDFNGTVKEQTACSAVNNAENIDELVDVFENHSVLEIDINKNGYISKLNDEAKGKLYARMCNKDYTRAEDIKNDYISGSALEYVNQTPYDVLKPVIEAVAVDLNLTFDSNYKLLEKNSLYSNYMMKEINTKKDYKTRDELNDAIAAAAKYVYKNYYESGNGAGNGGSSSSGGSSSGGNSGYPAFSKDDGNMQQTNTGKKAFSDLESVQWAKEAINALADDGIISGRNDECFAPLDNITREEFTKLVVLAFGYPVKKNSENRFTDVSSERWSIDYIGAAYENGIINGVSETEFAPTSNITRQDMTVILYRILKDKGIKGDSSEINLEDSEDIAGYAAEAVGSLYRLGIVKGVDENRFAPKENANRAMAAQLIYNCMNYVQR